MPLDVDSGDAPVELSSEDLARLNDKAGFSDFQRQKLEKDAKKNWDLFYKRNGDRFFKDRYWTRSEFFELFRTEKNQSDSEPQSCQKFLFEVGCGCGNFVIPLLSNDCEDKNKSITDEFFIFCCDISERAIDILKKHPIYIDSPHRIKAFTADITHNVESLTSELDGKLMDIVSLVFVLSSIEPLKFKAAISNVSKVLKVGGLVLFRDYAIYDKAMLRFNGKAKICDQFYARQDGTRAYFFARKELDELFKDCGFASLSVEYMKRETVNNATNDRFSRIFLQAKFRKLA